MASHITGEIRIVLMASFASLSLWYRHMEGGLGIRSLSWWMIMSFSHAGPVPITSHRLACICWCRFFDSRYCIPPSYVFVGLNTLAELIRVQNVVYHILRCIM